MKLEIIEQNEGKQVIQFIFSVNRDGKTYPDHVNRLFNPEDFDKIKCIKNGWDKDHDLFICFDHKDYKLNKEIYNPCIYAGKLYYEPF